VWVTPSPYLNVVVLRFSPTSPSRDEIVDELKTLRDLGQSMDPSLIVPIDVLVRVDEGVNPDTFTRFFLDEIRNRNDQIRGRMVRARVVGESLDASLQAWDSGDYKATQSKK